MSEGLKVGLILGGVGVVGFLLWRNSAATLASLGAGATTTPLGTSPGQPLPAAPSFVGAIPQQTMAPAAAAGTSSSSSALVSVAKLAAAPIVIPTTIAVKAGEAVAGGVVSAGKTVVSSVGSVVHALSSIF